MHKGFWFEYTRFGLFCRSKGPERSRISGAIRWASDKHSGFVGESVSWHRKRSGYGSPIVEENTGSAGGLTSANGHGERFARTTARTVRHGNIFPHDHARSRAYRWNEDGIAGISDRRQTSVLRFALWNGQDPILKERLFGLTGNEGNHGEDVKEYYFYLDNTPTHSYMKYLYKYPQAEFPYAQLGGGESKSGPGQPRV